MSYQRANYNLAMGVPTSTFSAYLQGLKANEIMVQRYVTFVPQYLQF
jgi:hypothetical protein